MVLINDKADCCGCRTCEQVCPKSAIVMKEDECGFLYPQINPRKCINCGLCVKKCAFQSGYVKRKEFEPFYGYAARHKDYDTMMKSRSGGAFTAISDVILENGGVIYGAGYYEKRSILDVIRRQKDKKSFYKIVHKRADTKEERDEFRGSKYVQSDLGNVFTRVRQTLEDGKTVLFTGTGCQVGALHVFLGKEYDNLITIDIVCHGVPSPKMWRDFLEMRESENGADVTGVDFRDKVNFGWKAHRESVWFDEKRISSRIYTKLFYMDTALRPSCFKCVYANKNRPGDLTIADFWGHEKAVPDFYDDDKGISLVMVNTKRGKELWDKAAESMDTVNCTGYPFRHTNMKRPTAKPDNYDEFWKEYLEGDFDFIVEKYCKQRVETYEQAKEKRLKKEKRRNERQKKKKRNRRKKKIRKLKQRTKNFIKKVIRYE